MFRSKKRNQPSAKERKKPHAKPKLKISFWGSASRDPREVLQHPDMQDKLDNMQDTLEKIRSVSDKVVNSDDASSSSS